MLRQNIQWNFQRNVTEILLQNNFSNVLCNIFILDEPLGKFTFKVIT